MIVLNGNDGTTHTISEDNWEEALEWTDTLVTHELIGEPTEGLSDIEANVMASELRDSGVQSELACWLWDCGGYNFKAE